jgi:hypothetical protein
MKINQVVVALGAYLSGAGSFRFGGIRISIGNTGTNPVHFTFATALKAIEEATLLQLSVLPQTLVIGSTSVTVSAN